MLLADQNCYMTAKQMALDLQFTIHKHTTADRVFSAKLEACHVEAIAFMQCNETEQILFLGKSSR